jgi:hypothetical protein
MTPAHNAGKPRKRIVMQDEKRRTMWSLRHVVCAILIVGLAAMSVLLLSYTYLSSPSAFTSDDLLCSAVCDDLLHGRDMTSWYLPGAPYLFPDIALLTPCQWLTPHVVAAFLTYGFVFHLCLAGVLMGLGRLSGLGGWQALTAAACGEILLVVLHLDGNAANRAFLLFHPGSHSGVVLVGLALLAMAVRSLQRGQSLLAGVVFLLMAASAAFSDRLLIVQFLAPMALGLVLLAARRLLPMRRACGQLALVTATIVLSFVIRLLVQRLGVHLLRVETGFLQPSWSDVPLIVKRLYQGVEHERLLLALIPLHLLAALLVLRSARRQASEGDGIGILLITLTILLSPLCAIGALVVSGAAQNPAIDRYTLSCWFLPALMLPLLLCWLPSRFARVGAPLAQCAVILFALQRLALMIPAIDWAKFQRPYPPLAQELDRLARQRGLVRGLGGFWLARYTSWFSRESLVINPLFVEGEPWFHASNPARFLPEDSEDLRDADGQFLLVREGDPYEPAPAVLELAYGVPTEKITVGSEQIWLYDSLRSAPFDRFLRSRLAERLRDRRPFIAPTQPRCLAQPKANLTRADAPGTLALPDGQPLDVRFDQPVSGRVIDVGAAHDNRLKLDFYLGEKRLGSLAVPSVPWTGECYDTPGIQSRLLSLPAALRDQTWDRIRLSAREGCTRVRVGHLLVFTEDVRGLDEFHARAFPSRVRMEGEMLLPVGAISPYRDEPDAAASGGRVRRAAIGVPGPLSFTPYLTLPPGRYRLRCALQVGDTTGADEVVEVRAWRVEPMTTLGELSLYGRDFTNAEGRLIREINFAVGEEAGRVCFGAISSGKSSVAIDYFDLIAESVSSSGGEN